MKKIQFQPNRYYRIANTANNNERLFYESRNYRHFLRLLSRHVSPIAYLKAYCLREDHFEILVLIKPDSEIPEKYKGRLHLPFAHTFNAYAKGMNSIYNRIGSLFREHFTREEIPLEEVPSAIARIRNFPKAITVVQRRNSAKDLSI